jgi:lycopene epsilon-cyclase
VNNYGVWEDEFKELGLAHTLEYTWPDAVCYFGEGREVTECRLCARTLT